ncbi:TRAP transporter small permease [uncultured Corynebacterium sp.]|uniref:TRAP transporter small permease n=1 Tax=uncultured Corynebacterium sp. TaxID=159447 RepID=UPI0026182C57|nr:TRAP transporter small permease [uncultured Corynebacterium sp.]
MTSSNFVHPGHHGTAERSTYGYHTEDHPGFDKIQNTVSAVCAWIAGAAILGLALVTLAEIVAREFFGAPLGWNISVTERYLLPITAFFGLVTTYRTGTHIAVESLFSKFAPKVQKTILLLIHLAVVITMIFVFIGGWNQTYMAFSLGHATLPGMADLATPDWTYRVIVPIAAALCAFVAALDFVRELITPWDRPYTDYDPGEEEV